MTLAAGALDAMKGHLLDESARGVFVIAATPFDDDGGLDLASLARLIDFYIGAGVHGLTILGMMGEAQKLTYEESCPRGRAHAAPRRRQAAGGGRDNPGLANVALLTSVAMSAGAAGVMIAPPAGLASDEQTEGYLHQACDMIGPSVPVVLQDYPQATGVHSSVSLLCRLFDELPQIKVLCTRTVRDSASSRASARAPSATKGGASPSWSATARSIIHWSWRAARTAR